MKVFSEADGAKILYAIVLSIAVDVVDYRSVGNFAFAPEPREPVRHVTSSVYPDLYVAFALGTTGYAAGGASRAAADFPTK